MVSVFGECNMSKTILITGVAGLLGSRLADWITENKSEYKIIGIDDLRKY